jgi:beta-glucosidase
MWKWIKRSLVLIVGLVAAIVAATLVYSWLGDPKLRMAGAFASGPAAGTFTFADIPRGRVLTDTEIDGFASRLIGQMTIEEKASQMSGDDWYLDLLRMAVVDRRYNLRPIPSGELKRLRIPPLMFSDGPRGAVVGRSTAFPSASARAASWDTALVGRVAEAIAQEIRAQGGNFWGGLCINLLRHPGWGRAQETFGEDPYLLGELAAASIEAVQRHNVIACAKHYALNSIEEDRNTIDVRVDERTLREVYLPHFRRAVDAGTASVMSSYNRVNGDYAGENRFLLTEVLKRDWGFRGFVMSDFFTGIHDAKKAANAGLDVEMPWARQYRRLPTLVAAGEVPISIIDDAVMRVLREKIRFATRPDPMRYDMALVASPEHLALAREAAEQSIVLLKNDGPILPLDRARVKTVALVGALADRANTGDMGSSNVVPPGVITVLAGLKEAAGSSVRVLHDPGTDPASLKTAITGADAVVVVAGLTSQDEGEWIPSLKLGRDRRSLALRAADISLIRTVAAANPNTVVVLEGGSAITTEEWKSGVRAILMAFYPGMEGGRAIARVLFGDVNPSGKMTVTTPAHPSWLPPFTPLAPAIDYGYYHGYTLAEKRGVEPAYAFGSGLSYTRFTYANLQVFPAEVPADGRIDVAVDVTNAGARAGREVTQLYIGFPNAAIDRPVKLLRGFNKIEIAPGETKTVRFSVNVADLAYWDQASKAWKVERVPHDVYVGGSSRTADLLRTSVTVVDAAPAVPVQGARGPR